MAVDMFLKFADAANIKGESTDKTHTKQIDVLSWSWGLSNSGTTHTGGGGGGGKVSVDDIQVTKYIDSSSHALIDACATGKHIPNAWLYVRKAGGTPLEYVILELTEVLITAVSTGGSGGEDRLTETVSLNFAKYSFSYVPQKADGTGDTALTAVYNIAQNSKEG